MRKLRGAVIVLSLLQLQLFLSSCSNTTDVDEDPGLRGPEIKKRLLARSLLDDLSPDLVLDGADDVVQIQQLGDGLVFVDTMAWYTDYPILSDRFLALCDKLRNDSEVLGVTKEAESLSRASSKLATSANWLRTAIDPSYNGEMSDLAAGYLSTEEAVPDFHRILNAPPGEESLENGGVYFNVSSLILKLIDPFLIYISTREGIQNEVLHRISGINSRKDELSRSSSYSSEANRLRDAISLKDEVLQLFDEVVRNPTL